MNHRIDRYYALFMALPFVLVAAALGWRAHRIGSMPSGATLAFAVALVAGATLALGFIRRRIEHDANDLRRGLNDAAEKLERLADIGCKMAESDWLATERPRLTTNQFLALRSIAREPWDMQWGRIQWRFNGKWLHLFRYEGVRAPLGSVDGIGGRCGYGDIAERAWEAAWELVGRGLVEVVTERCCHSASCHRNDRDEFRLTPRGSALLQQANATSQQRRTD